MEARPGFTEKLLESWALQVECIKGWGGREDRKTMCEKPGVKRKISIFGGQRGNESIWAWCIFQEVRGVQDRFTSWRMLKPKYRPLSLISVSEILTQCLNTASSLRKRAQRKGVNLPKLHFSKWLNVGIHFPSFFPSFLHFFPPFPTFFSHFFPSFFPSSLPAFMTSF